MAQDIVTRFAPSPTGFLHIGGARTALFNWLFAKHHGGKMLLRIEDTDRARSTQEAVDALMDGLSWLGLDWDGEPISQFSRVARHEEVVDQMLENGTAYRCYSTPEEVDAMREKARAEGRPPRYDGTWRDKDASEAPEGIDPVIRLKAPQDGETVVDDMVQGRVVIPNKDLDDFVLLRSDGTPTYMLAVVVDDHDMGITHIIRGVDHLTNAARQTLIFDANGWDVPKMAHIPLIHGPDGAKLSKRHGATGAEAYRALGYLPQAMRNYLARLGWSHGDEEIMSLEDMVKWFGMDAVGQSAARFDFKKLENLNGHYMRATDDAELLEHWKVYLAHAGDGAAVLEWMSDAANAQTALTALPGLKERAKTLVELTDSASYLWRQRPLENDEKAIKILTDDARAVLGDLNGVLSGVADWQAEPLEAAVKAYAEDKDVKLGKVAQPLRAALTGRGTSPGIYDVLIALGRDESLARIADQAA
ncbi:glutamate--tRNA ligase [Roseibium alexandrii]|uniref:Glutamate--tRNA ligase n=1 Tax=Roseibium alexandrii (strain DSM 17067 / NCIMB 14079 / DFL-11) TaxID=244592 RepID=A0A5E8GVV9_ROSAD|nr:glutamate--tRNA ligase [Roseibium alexandrii]EEE43064.1 glutamyl-tRNA synthetase, bacterial family [Roseibium alexandrii DFL-11]